MYSCISGGGLAYRIDLDIVKSPSTPSRTSQSSSPSSTLSESTNSSPRISTRKPRTPRKRPNQSYNEAAALLSTIYPNIFSTQNLRKPCRNPKEYDFFSDEFPELLPPSPGAIDNVGFLLDQQVPDKPTLQTKPKPANSSGKPCQSPLEIDSQPDSKYDEDFDAESMLDEEIEEGIDSIMGNLTVSNDSYDDSNGFPYNAQFNSYSGNQMGMGFGGRLGMGMRALRNVDNGDWWRFPIVDVLQISPKLNKETSSSSQKKKKKKRKAEHHHKEEIKKSGPCNDNNDSLPKSGLSLKLNYEEVLNAWSDRGSPFSDEFPVTFSPGSDSLARLKQIDLFPENNGGVREASVMRYREKRRSRLFSKKIRYQVRKVNADQRPRMKGRFARRKPMLSSNGQRQ